MNKPLRGAVIGYGFIMEKGHGAAFHERRERARAEGREPDVELVAVADVCRARRELAARHFPGLRTYADFLELLDAEADHLDFVDIATPPAKHAAVARAALGKGLHVLCEKPLATTIADARDMLDCAITARRVLYPCHNYKHAPVIRSVRKLIAAGAIGNVHLITLQTFRNTHARGVPEWRPDWRRERRHSGGGIAMDHGCHTFYLAFEWMRAYPTAIAGRMSNLGSHDTEDDFSCSLRFPTGVASAHLSWRAGMRKVIYTIRGSQGAIRVEDDHIEVSRSRSGHVVDAAHVDWHVERHEIPSDWMDSSHLTWFGTLFDGFRQAIAAGEWVGKETEESLLCIQLIQTAYASAQQGSRELPLPDLELGEQAAKRERLA